MNERAWTARPWISRVLRLAMFVGPLVGGFAAVAAAMRVVARPSGPALIAWIALLVGVSAAGAHVIQTMTMRLAPLSALFRLSLVFPDEAPSRFSIALRGGSTGRLRERQTTAGSEQAAAEHLLDLVAELSTHDRSTRGHSERVRAYSVMLGEEIGLPQEELDRLNWAALIHDIGKLHVPEEILNKPGRPTEEEWQILRSHPGAAAEHVEALRPWLGDWVDASTQHHERFDGGGYPAGLRGGEISLAGRLVAIADAFDVMTAPRSYKPSLPHEQARAELLNCAGSQFDPGLVRSFLRISLGRTRWIAGPLGWLSHFPEIIRTPVVAVASGGQAAVVATVVTVAAATGIVEPPSVGPEDSAERIVAEEAVSEVATPASTSASPDPVAGPVDESAPASSTTTTSASADATPGESTNSTTSLPVAVAPSTTTQPPNGGDGPSTTPPPSTTTTTLPSSTTTTSTTTTSTTSTTTTSTTTTSTTTTAPPGVIAVNDSLTITREGTTTVHVTINDDFGSSNALPGSLQVIGSTHHGVVTVSGLNLKYELDEGETSGSESFTYSICAAAGGCDTATVTLTIDVS